MVDATPAELTKLRDKILETCAEFASSDGDQDVGDVPLLYHMTDLEAAFTIAATGTLRASETSALNDAKEVQYGRELAADCLAKKHLHDLDPPVHQVAPQRRLPRRAIDSHLSPSHTAPD